MFRAITESSISIDPVRLRIAQRHELHNTQSCKRCYCHSVSRNSVAQAIRLEYKLTASLT